MTDEKASFINNEIWLLTFDGGLQRSNVYKKGVEDSIRIKFRSFVRKEIEAIYTKSYKDNIIADSSHVKNLLRIKQNIDKNYSRILSGNEIKLGVVQKLLNLYLKYQWCIGNSPPPPHCPFDRIIISKLGLRKPPNWTQLNDKESYLELVNTAKDIAHPKSLAEWELSVFSRRTDT